MSERDREEERQDGVGLKEREDQKVQKPRRYKVLIHNDDFTPIDWVMGLVEQVFRKNWADAQRITFEVHEKGSAVAGVYTYGIAETKVAIVLHHAKRDGHPLMASMEPE